MLTKRFFVVALLSCLLSVSAYSQSKLRPGSPAPLFTGNLVDGSSMGLSDLKGSVVVITFWTTRCIICRYEMPLLDRMVRQYDPKKVVFLALTTENQQQVASYLKKNPYRFHIMTDSFGTLLSYADRDRAGNIDMGYPSFFVVDKRGLVQYRTSGYDKTADLNEAVSRLASE